MHNWQPLAGPPSSSYMSTLSWTNSRWLNVLAVLTHSGTFSHLLSSGLHKPRSEDLCKALHYHPAEQLLMPAISNWGKIPANLLSLRWANAIRRMLMTPLKSNLRLAGVTCYEVMSALNGATQVWCQERFSNSSKVAICYAIKTFAKPDNSIPTRPLLPCMITHLHHTMIYSTMEMNKPLQQSCMYVSTWK